MRIINKPDRKDWPDLCGRPGIARTDLENTVRAIMDKIRSEGDTALMEYTRRFDGVSLTALAVSDQERNAAVGRISMELQTAIRTAFENIHRFHLAQQPRELVVETMPGVVCRRVPRPISPVGLYIPGGSAPLFSTVLMLGIPARIAGCEDIVLCSPPQPDGTIHPAILFAAECCGIKTIFKCGGAQAIAAMSIGTETIPAVNKIFGPGNQFVTCAKQMAAMNGVAIDLPAGPSEVLVIADADADPAFIAADLLSQAEHGADSQVVLVTDSGHLPEQVLREIRQQLEVLPRADVATKALENSLCVVTSSMQECIAFSNTYAPEHLIVNCTNAMDQLTGITNAGSVFIGPWTPESAGDYASGTNHTLPTGGYARSSAGVSVDSFVRYMTVQEITPNGLRKVGPVVETMAEAESLLAHKQAVSIRLNKLL
ncbi:MAG: histidinol dehydrogenase [Bacteroidota bacterium]